MLSDDQILHLTCLTYRPIFSVEHRTKLLSKITAKLGDQVEIVKVEGLLADYV